MGFANAKTMSHDNKPYRAEENMSNIEIIKPPSELRAGQDIVGIRKSWEEKRKNYPQSQFTLDLSEVVYMDSYGFRLVFDFLSMFGVVVAPKDTHIIEMYDFWLDSKKGLKKNAR